MVRECKNRYAEVEIDEEDVQKEMEKECYEVEIDYK